MAGFGYSGVTLSLIFFSIFCYIDFSMGSDWTDWPWILEAIGLVMGAWVLFILPIIGHNVMADQCLFMVIFL